MSHQPDHPKSRGESLARYAFLSSLGGATAGLVIAILSIYLSGLRELPDLAIALGRITLFPIIGGLLVGGGLVLVWKFNPPSQNGPTQEESDQEEDYRHMRYH